jgi:hypothetical protein
MDSDGKVSDFDRAAADHRSVVRLPASGERRCRQDRFVAGQNYV